MKRSRFTRSSLLPILAAFLLFTQLASATNGRFRKWFPRYRAPLNHIVDTICAKQYDAFLDHSRETRLVDPDLAVWIGDKQSPAHPLIQCLLAAIPEVVKASMAGAQVVLGLMPTILAMLGPSVQETAYLFVVARRPLLAVLVALGSPGVAIQRSFEFRKHFEAYQPSAGAARLRSRNLLLGGYGGVVVLYTLALAAMANIGELSWELGIKVSYSMAQDSPYLPGWWGFVGVAIHLMGAAALRQRITVRTASKLRAQTSSSVLEVARRQFEPTEKQGLIEIDVRSPSVVYLVLTWAATVLTACHIVFGTMLFSGILFMSVVDSIVVILRYMGSVILCRMIILYELALVQDSLRLGCTPEESIPQNNHEIQKDGRESM